MSFHIHTFPGKGEAIYAVHGFGGFAHDFEAFAAAIDNPLKAIQLPLDRESVWDDDCFKTNKLLTKLSQTIPRNSIVLGYSMGARLVLQWATRISDSAPKSLILISGTAGIQSVEARELRQISDKSLINRLKRDGVASFFEWWSQIPIIQSQQRIAPEFRHAMNARRMTHSIRSLQASLRDFGQGTMPSCWALIHNIECPVLLISGSEDLKYRQIAEALNEKIPFSSLAVISDSGHCPHLENIQETTSQILTWFDMYVVGS